MISEHLADYRDNAIDLLEEAVPFLVAGKVDYNLLLEICGHYRVKGAVNLLLEADAAAFHADLSKGARAFLFGLEVVPPATVVTGKALPFFDAVASGDDDAALRIASKLPREPRLAVEYEEDFYFVSLLARRLIGEIDEAGCEVILESWTALNEGDERLALAASLVRRDPESFESSFPLFLESYRSRYHERLMAGQIPDEVGHTLGHLCVEGMAVVRLAEGAGIPTAREYPLVPSLARSPAPPSPDPHAWRRA